jgi:hypothetical protein
MKTEFIPYKQALELKELGFDEPCFGLWNLNNGKYEVDIIGVCQYSKEFKYREVLAPLYQQVFRWFREKYDKYGVVNIDLSNNLKDKIFVYMVEDKLGYIIDRSEEYNTYEEAELACLNKLIEIVKNK